MPIDNLRPMPPCAGIGRWAVETHMLACNHVDVKLEYGQPRVDGGAQSPKPPRSALN